MTGHLTRNQKIELFATVDLILRSKYHLSPQQSSQVFADALQLCQISSAIDDILARKIIATVIRLVNSKLYN